LINKSDRNDAVGIARIMQCEWYRELRVKGLDSHTVKALLVSQALLVKIKRDLENQTRELPKNLGLVIGRARMNVFAVHAAELIQGRLELTAAVVPLLATREGRPHFFGYRSGGGLRSTCDGRGRGRIFRMTPHLCTRRSGVGRLGSLQGAFRPASVSSNRG
jgi:hypothetical protein